MKLVFYSGGDEKENLALDLDLRKLFDKENPKITYIPSCSLDGELEFSDFVSRYRKMGILRFQYCPIDIPQSDIFFKEALKSDMLYLSGGNTYYFLKHLKKSKLFHALGEYVKKGGILTGLSAGGILMTPNIQTAGYPSFDCDENEENITNLKSLNLVNFEFFPHYRNSKRYDGPLKKESARSPYPVYAIPDGSGIIVDGDSISFLGRAYGFYQGGKFSIR